MTALQPSPAMAAALRQATAVPDSTTCGWWSAVGDARVGPHDLVNNAGGGDKFFFRELYPALLGRPYERGGDREGPLRALAALGITPRVALVEDDSDQPLSSLEEACDFWMTYLRLDGEDARAFLRDFLADRLVRDAGGWRVPYRKRARVIAWRTSGAPRGRR